MTALGSPRLEVDVHQARLTNGLDVAVSPDPRLGFVVVNTWHAAGSMNDCAGMSGLAHIAEHVCFDDPADPRIRADARTYVANATTGFERTNFVDVGPPDMLPTLLARVASRIEYGGAAAATGEVDRQRSVVLQEIRQREDTAHFGSGMRRSLRLLFGAHHPMGQPALGSPDDLDAVTGADVSAFVTAGYGAANTVVSVVGSVMPDQAIEEVAKACAQLPAGQQQRRPEMDILSAAAREDVQEGQPAGLLRLTLALPADGEPLGPAGEVLMAALVGAPWSVFGSRFGAEHDLLGATGEHVRCHAGPSIGMMRLAVPVSVELAKVEQSVRACIRRVPEVGLGDGVRAAAVARCRKQQLARVCGARSRAEELCQQQSWFGNANQMINTRSYEQVDDDDIRRVATTAGEPAVVAFHPTCADEPSWIL